MHRLVAKFVFKHIGGKSAQFGIFNIEEESGFILLFVCKCYTVERIATQIVVVADVVGCIAWSASEFGVGNVCLQHHKFTSRIRELEVCNIVEPVFYVIEVGDFRCACHLAVDNREFGGTVFHRVDNYALCFDIVSIDGLCNSPVAHLAHIQTVGFECLGIGKGNRCFARLIFLVVVAQVFLVMVNDVFTYLFAEHRFYALCSSPLGSQVIDIEMLALVREFCEVGFDFAIVV